MNQVLYRLSAVALLLPLACSAEAGSFDNSADNAASNQSALTTGPAGQNASAALVKTAPAGLNASAAVSKTAAAGQSAAVTALSTPTVAGAVNRSGSDTGLAGDSAGRRNPPLPTLATPSPAAVASALAAATASGAPSAHRDPNKDWTTYLPSASARTTGGAVAATAVASVVDSKVPVANANFANVPVWSDTAIWEQFRASRDARFMTDGSGYVRRPSWMYPDDGCWVRAELAAIESVEAGKAKPWKLFSFGNLTVSTPNAPGGSVSWWYHVVPVVKSLTNNVPYVLDPAIDPTQPLPYQTWLLRQVSSLSNVQITVADSGAYNPSSPVTGGSTPAKATVVSDMQYYLGQEWSRQISLGRDPVNVLGYLPPWGNVGKDFDTDRRSDIIWHHGGNGLTQYWYMNGTTRTNYANLSYTVADSSGWTFAGTGDFNRDGKADIVWHHGGNGLTQIWYMNGLTRTSYANLANTVSDASGWKFVAADDFNYDGKTDIVWHNGTTGYTQIWYLDDALNLLNWPSLDTRYLVTDASGWTFAGTGDFNHDGRTDVIWRQGSTGTMQMWYLNGVTMTTYANLPYTVSDASGWRFFSARDFNYDGKPDILWQQKTAGTIQLWAMDGLTRTSYNNLPYTVADSSGWFGGGY